MKSYKKLLMWQKSNELVMLVYKLTTKYPKNEVYGIISQLRRAAVSVVLNIVEGYARGSSGEFRRFLDISLGSLAEVEYLLELSVELNYLTEAQYNTVESLRLECGKIIWTYRNKIK